MKFSNSLVKAFSIFQSYAIGKRLLYLFIAAVIIRSLLTGFFVWERGELRLGSDSLDYIQYADYILDQGVFVLDIAGLRAHSGPGYPLIIVLGYLVFGAGNYILPIIINILFGSLVIPVVYLISVRTISEKWSWAPTLWAMFYIPQIWEAQYLMKESLVFGLFMLSILIVIKLAEQAKISLLNAVLFTLVYGYLIHTDERYFFYLPFLLAFILLFSRQNQPGVSWSKVLLISALLGLFMIPWLYRNYQVYNRLVILTERTAKFTDPLLGYTTPVNKYRGERNNYYDIYSEEGRTYYYSMIDSVKEGYKINSGRADWKVIRDVESGLEAGIVPEINTRIETYTNHFFHLWLPIAFKNRFGWHGLRFEKKWNFDRALVTIIFYLSLIPLFIYGVYRSFTQKNRLALFLFSLTVIHTVIHVFLAHAITRYREPIDPLIIIIAFYGLHEFMNAKRIISDKTLNPNSLPSGGAI